MVCGGQRRPSGRSEGLAQWEGKWKASQAGGSACRKAQRSKRPWQSEELRGLLPGCSLEEAAQGSWRRQQRLRQAVCGPQEETWTSAQDGKLLRGPKQERDLIQGLLSEVLHVEKKLWGPL